jgi:putative redox protein
MVTTRARLTLESLEDGLRFRGEDDAGRSVLLDSGEGAIAPSPVVALLLALGGCSGMDVIGVLRKKRQRVTAYTIELVGQRREEHPRSFTAIEVVHRVSGHGLDPQAIADAIELSDTKYCSVHATLVPGVTVTSRFVIDPPAAEE